jgi:hypothetical protein
MFYFRLDKVRIFDNREAGFLFFKRNLAEIKFVSFITTGDTSFPDLDAFIAETDPDKRAQLAAKMVAQVVSNRILSTIDNVKDNQDITFGDTGYVLFQTQDIPQDFNWCLLALEDDGDLRELGVSIDSILSDEGFPGFSLRLAQVVGAASNPAFAAGIEIAKFVAGTIAERLRAGKNDLVGLLYMSLNRREHYPHGMRKRDKVPDLTGNMLVDYSLFGFENPVI